MTPAAERLLAALADGYHVEVEYVGGWDADEWHLRKSIKFDGRLRDAARELYGLGLVNSSANGNGSCWINDAGRVESPPVVDFRRCADCQRDIPGDEPAYVEGERMALIRCAACSDKARSLIKLLEECADHMMSVAPHSSYGEQLCERIEAAQEALRAGSAPKMDVPPHPINTINLHPVGTPCIHYSNCPTCGVGYGQPHVEPPKGLSQEDDPIIDAQHDETGRMWQGRRSKLPARFREVGSASGEHQQQNDRS